MRAKQVVWRGSAAVLRRDPRARKRLAAQYRCVPSTPTLNIMFVPW